MISYYYYTVIRSIIWGSRCTPHIIVATLYSRYIQTLGTSYMIIIVNHTDSPCTSLHCRCAPNQHSRKLSQSFNGTFPTATCRQGTWTGRPRISSGGGSHLLLSLLSALAMKWPVPPRVSAAGSGPYFISSCCPSTPSLPASSPAPPSVSATWDSSHWPEKANARANLLQTTHASTHQLSGKVPSMYEVARLPNPVY